MLLNGLIEMRIHKIRKTKYSYNRSMNESIRLHYQKLKTNFRIYQIENPKLINIKLTFLSKDISVLRRPESDEALQRSEEMSLRFCSSWLKNNETNATQRYVHFGSHIPHKNSCWIVKYREFTQFLKGKK
jgi:hypothetical protein